MYQLIENLSGIITAAAKSYLGILALLPVALSVLAYLFFAKASDKFKAGIFIVLFLGVAGFRAAMFQVNTVAPNASGTDVSMSALTEEAKALLTGATDDPSRLVFYEYFGTTVDLHTNGQSLFTDKWNHSAIATWEAALQELIDNGLFAARGDNGEVFEITKEGYEIAGKLMK